MNEGVILLIWVALGIPGFIFCFREGFLLALIALGLGPIGYLVILCAFLFG